MAEEGVLRLEAKLSEILKAIPKKSTETSFRERFGGSSIKSASGAKIDIFGISFIMVVV